MVTTTPHYAVAVMIKALAKVAWPYELDSGGGSSHLLMRALDALPDLLRSFDPHPEGFGHDVGDDLATGVSELARKCVSAPNLVEPLVSAAQAFVPDLLIRPLRIKDRKAREAQARVCNRPRLC